MDERYRERRAELEARFGSYQPVEGSAEVFVSPSGRFRLTTQRHKTGERTWEYSRGLVERLADGAVLAEIKRNYSHFWHAWVAHPNGKEYMLCGEDYQGYTVVDLEAGREHTYFPDSGYDGWGFCWTAVYPSPDGRILAVDGCFWACPYEIVFCDFETPDRLPLPELKRLGPVDDVSGWEDNETFVFRQEFEVRKSDGVPYDDLSDEEQDVLDRDSSLLDLKYETVRVNRGDLR